jgi:hypothetical protein
LEGNPGKEFIFRQQFTSTMSGIPAGKVKEPSFSVMVDELVGCSSYLVAKWSERGGDDW